MAGDKDPSADTDKGGDPGEDKTKAKGGSADTDKGGEDLQAEVDKWKALARQHEGLWKSTGLTKDELPEAKALLAKAKDTDAKSKTAEDRIAALEQKIAEAEAKSTRLEVAAAKGLTPAMAKRLVGTTREELEADADELAAALKSEGKGAEGGEADDKSGRPKEKLKPGAVPNSEPEETDPKKLAEKIPRMYG